jgi:hypothetical protein
MLVYNHTLENLDAERFTLRDADKGTNMDYMSYSIFFLVGQDPNALLNASILQKYSEQTFQTFFKYFATKANWTHAGDSRIYRAAYEEAPYLSYSEWERFNNIVTERIEVLNMNKEATWLSMTILFLLMIILVILLIVFQVVYPPTSMLRHMECLADVLAMVAGSDELVRLVDEIGVKGMQKAGIKARLGWFRDKRGTVRWCIDVVDGNMEWVDGPEEETSDERAETSATQSGSNTQTEGKVDYVSNYTGSQQYIK